MTILLRSINIIAMSGWSKQTTLADFPSTRHQAVQCRPDPPETIHNSYRRYHCPSSVESSLACHGRGLLLLHLLDKLLQCQLQFQQRLPDRLRFCQDLVKRCTKRSNVCRELLRLHGFLCNFGKFCFPVSFGGSCAAAYRSSCPTALSAVETNSTFSLLD